MHIKKIEIKNFRLLKNISLSLENKVTVIVGRNNSGKTSLTEIFRRIASESSLMFSLEDFCLSVHEDFWQAFLLHKVGSDEMTVRDKIPKIAIDIQFTYDINSPGLGPLSDFIIDLNLTSKDAIANVNYHLKEGAIESFFHECSYIETENLEMQKIKFFKLMKERVPKLFAPTVFAIDPTDSTNQKKLEMSNLRNLLMSGFINAQRGMDDVTHKESDILGRVLEKLLSAANSESANATDKNQAKEIDSVVKGIQEKIDSEFNHNLAKLLPALQRFGYPGLSDPQLRTETVLDVQRLLGNHTKLRYGGANGIGLPEAYNGLGSRNLIFILFQLYEFFKSYQAKEAIPGVHLIFIEEPEAHLHPQMQEVFIRKISEIATAFDTEAGGLGWPVQIVVTTHSTHMANEAPFETIRYFLSSKTPFPQTQIKDLKAGFCETPSQIKRDFAERYSNLFDKKRCSLASDSTQMNSSLKEIVHTSTSSMPLSTLVALAYPEACKKNRVKLPPFHVNQFAATDASTFSQKIREIIENKKRLPQIDICLKKNATNMRDCSGHVTTISGIRENCCGNICKNEYQFTDSMKTVWASSETKDGWVSEEEVMDRNKIFQQSPNSPNITWIESGGPVQIGFKYKVPSHAGDSASIYDVSSDSPAYKAGLRNGMNYGKQETDSKSGIVTVWIKQPNGSYTSISYKP